MSGIAAEQRISIESNTSNSNFHGSFLRIKNTQHARSRVAVGRVARLLRRPTGPSCLSSHVHLACPHVCPVCTASPPPSSHHASLATSHEGRHCRGRRMQPLRHPSTALDELRIRRTRPLDRLALAASSLRRRRCCRRRASLRASQSKESEAGREHNGRRSRPEPFGHR